MFHSTILSQTERSNDPLRFISSISLSGLLTQKMGNKIGQITEKKRREKISRRRLRVQNITSPCHPLGIFHIPLNPVAEQHPLHPPWKNSFGVFGTACWILFLFPPFPPIYFFFFFFLLSFYCCVDQVGLIEKDAEKRMFFRGINLLTSLTTLWCRYPL